MYWKGFLRGVGVTLVFLVTTAIFAYLAFGGYDNYPFWYIATTYLIQVAICGYFVVKHNLSKKWAIPVGITGLLSLPFILGRAESRKNS